MGSTDFFLDRIRTSWYNAFRSRLERFSDALGVRGCDTDRKDQKSVDIYGLLAQLVGRLKQFIQLGFSPQVRKTRWHGSVGRTTKTSYPTGKFPAGAENKVAWLSR